MHSQIHRHAARKHCPGNQGRPPVVGLRLFAKALWLARFPGFLFVPRHILSQKATRDGPDAETADSLAQHTQRQQPTTASGSLIRRTGPRPLCRAFERTATHATTPMALLHVGSRLAVLSVGRRQGLVLGCHLVPLDGISSTVNDTLDKTRDAGQRNTVEPVSNPWPE